MCINCFREKSYCTKEAAENKREKVQNGRVMFLHFFSFCHEEASSLNKNKSQKSKSFYLDLIWQNILFQASSYYAYLFLQISALMKAKRYAYEKSVLYR